MVYYFSFIEYLVAILNKYELSGTNFYRMQLDDKEISYTGLFSMNSIYHLHNLPPDYFKLLIDEKDGQL